MNELVLGVNIALGRAPLQRCPAYPLCANGRVCVSVLVDVVGKALRGCFVTPG